MNLFSFFTNVYSFNFFELLPIAFYLAYPLPKRKHFWWIAFGGLVLAYLFGLLLNYLTRVIFFNIPSWGTFFMILFFFVTIFIGTLFVYATFKVNWREAIFIGIVAYTFRHMVYLLGRFVETYLTTIYFSQSQYTRFAAYHITHICLYILASPALYFLHYIIRKNPSIVVTSWQSLIFATVALMFDDISNLYILRRSQVGDTAYIVAILGNFFACLLLIMLMFGFLNNSKLQQEAAVLKKLRAEEASQYQISQETIDSINRKTHDIRHQIRDLAKRNGSVSPEEIASLEEATRIYDTRLSTGNHTIDVILQDKALIAKNHGIIFHCIVEGTSLLFLKSSDAYSFLGNILDNAIEPTSKVDPKKRYITLKIRSVAGGCSVYEENPYVGTISFKNGLPQTDNEDKSIHGYGMKSIQYVVDSYQGTMMIETKNQVFVFQAFFPLTDVKQKTAAQSNNI